MEVKFSSPPLGSAVFCRVFVPNDQGLFDLSDLRRFGTTVKMITPIRAIYPDQSDEHELTLINRISEFLRDSHFRYDKDYVALTGDPIVSASVMFVLGKIVDEAILLRYDGQARLYWPFRMRFNRGVG